MIHRCNAQSAVNLPSALLKGPIRYKTLQLYVCLRWDFLSYATVKSPQTITVPVIWNIKAVSDFMDQCERKGSFGECSVNTAGDSMFLYDKVKKRFCCEEHRKFNSFPRCSWLTSFIMCLKVSIDVIHHCIASIFQMTGDDSLRKCKDS